MVINSNTNKHVQQGTVPSDLGCPFCALVCDDVSLPVRNGTVWTDALDCPKAQAGFQLALSHINGTPLIDGKVSDWDSTLNHARHLLDGARLPLFHGLIGDLLDARAVWSMAAHFNGVVDHQDGNTVARNLAVYQDSGWIVTSLGEVRNRADLLIWVGEPIDDELPRLRSRLLEPVERLHTDKPIDILELGPDPLAIIDQTRTLLGKRPLTEPLAATSTLTQRLGDADYPVFAIGRLQGPRAELALRATSDLVRDINEQRRAALLLLSTGLGDASAQLSGAWHNGFGIRTSLARGYPVQDLHHFAGQALLDDGQTDLLVWISSLSPTGPPSCEQPQIVFGHPAMQFAEQAPAVFLPVAVPGIHRPGFMHRGDGLRLVPLHGLHDNELPSTAQLVERLIAESSRGAEAC